MGKYKVSVGAYVYYNIVVDAEDEGEAETLGVDAIMSGMGTEDPRSFEWQDDITTEEVEEN
jgi:hypothetical protein